ncbi:MAG: glycosyltransferase [Elusimicrobia bacterium]|nr:glycosyltransferase [Elusimicrobiota bacterium]
MKKTVSVILPLYNNAETLGRSAQSILDQTFKDFELIIVDDASTDGGAEILERFQDPRIRVIRHAQNKGRSQARNAGIDEAKGEYIAFIDADDAARPTRLEEQVKFLEDHPDIALCGAWAEFVYPDGTRAECRHPTDPKTIRKTALASPPFVHATVIVRKETLKEVGGFDRTLKMAEDYDLYLRIAAKYSTANLPKVFCDYTVHAGWGYRCREQWAKIPVRWRAMRRYGYSWWNLPFLFTPLLSLWIPQKLKLHFRKIRRGTEAGGPIDTPGGKIKICEVIESGGGSGQQAIYICNGLNKDRFEVTLIYSLRPDSPNYASEIQGCRLIYLPEMVRPIHPLKDFRALLKLWRLLKKERPQVLHLHSSKAGFLGRLAGLLAGVPKIYYSPHGYSFRMTDSLFFMRRLYYALEWLASRIGHIVAVAPGEKAMAQKLAGRRPIYPIYNAVPDPCATPRDEVRAELREPGSAGGAVISACGRIAAAKNPEAFLRLARRLIEKYPQIQIQWIGGGEKGEVEKFLNLALRWGVSGNLRLTGWLARPNALEELQKSDIIVHYSLWDVLPNAVLEAMGLGKPTVVSEAVDSILDEKTGLVAKDEQELLQKTCRLIESPELRKELGEAARKSVREQYSLQRMISQLEALYLQ